MSAFIYILEKAPDQTLWADLPDMPLVIASGENMATLEFNLRTAMDSYLSATQEQIKQPMTWSQAEAVVMRRAKDMGVDPSCYEMHVISKDPDGGKNSPVVQMNVAQLERPSPRRSFIKKIFIN